MTRLVLVSLLAILALFTAPAAASDSPSVTFGTPINETTSSHSSTTITISDGTLIISGDASDEDGVSHISIARTYRYHDAEDDGVPTEVERSYRTFGASNGSFEHQVALGTDRNEVNISVVDEQGYPTKLN
ncbi:MAG: hypothetical protein ABEI98_04740, partial [Halorhabdus sp.]